MFIFSLFNYESLLVKIFLVKQSLVMNQANMDGIMNVLRRHVHNNINPIK